MDDRFKSDNRRCYSRPVGASGIGSGGKHSPISSSLMTRVLPVGVWPPFQQANSVSSSPSKWQLAVAPGRDVGRW